MRNLVHIGWIAAVVGCTPERAAVFEAGGDDLAVQRGLEHLERWLGEVGLPDVELEVRRARVTAGGMAHLHTRQTWRGLQVLGVRALRDASSGAPAWPLQPGVWGRAKEGHRASNGEGRATGGVGERNRVGDRPVRIRSHGARHRSVA